MPWQDLPIELILRILEALDPSTLIVSRGVSRLFIYSLSSLSDL
jgi:F-box domain